MTRPLQQTNCMTFLTRISFFFFLALLLGSCGGSEPDWQYLVKDPELTAWEVRNGKASYILEDGVVIGTTVANSPNTFLCTRKQFDDFILEFEVMVDPNINSGVQFRSHSRPEYNDGQIHGYQAEIDPSPRAWSGGIYEEGKRGWLYTLENNPEGRTAFKNGSWNHYRIEAFGNQLAIWVNGINTANLIDEAESSGFIGLQVHSIPDDSLAGKQIKWRNIRLLTQGAESFRSETTAPLIRK
ncbi:protein of unknown function [Robiginitalea myxolifaciens]|uniref:3-keto-alpha-glucoside-1,2-lyase/3-keto-2-hydroxy-glucal hydratase domain-containing protein n=1 Tax=Robiginitalea myxolifaciens TaxID=400055 RepID=A0A1I6H1D8_9FLAO|nr:DUF1080 domain-containing protein [Robiginitalea myxolifaciens]SFR48260.1 protein of unknown function [Robiginitalea myxolifaciens]